MYGTSKYKHALFTKLYTLPPCLTMFITRAMLLILKSINT